jgi:tRNA(fMet)-specific endonuclease VapC
MGYLLDTNIVSDLVRFRHGRIRERIRSVGEWQVCTSIIVAAEWRFGEARRASARLSSQIEELFSGLEILPFDAPADLHYGRIRAELQRAGKPIGGNDLLIAAHALALEHTLVTDNTREFSRIAGLSCENWLRP